MIKFFWTCIPLILIGIFLNFILVVICKIIDATNNKKIYSKVLIVWFILSILSIVLISSKEFEALKNYLIPQLQESSVLSVFVAILIFYVTFFIVYIVNIFILELWWRIKLKSKR